MPLSAGDQLGPYEILSPLGAGGMGEVYRARDTRLDRSVAIKVLPEHIAQREDARARFEREARSVASLNHPNICTLHDIGPNYMVMELIDGETLAARIEKGPIPLDQALSYAIQIADALDRAHRAGVTHRDIKPHNIMLTRDGVKVLDFGLAKSATTTTGPTEATLTKVLTTEGMVIGTPQYMAPEQFEGKEADARSDIWAFGAVLYEMVTERKAFEGKNYTSLVAAILGGEPAPMAVKPFTPAWLERLVRRCLAKDPEDRWQTMRDVVLELRTPPQETVSIAPRSRLGWVVAACTLFLSGVIAWRGHAPRPAPLRPLIRLNAEIAPDLSVVLASAGLRLGNTLALSPDGGRLALVLRSTDGQVLLHTRLLSQSHPIPLAGTKNAISPFFSPDGQWIGFFADGKLKKIAVDGGAAFTVCEAPRSGTGSWGDDGNIILAQGARGSVLSRVPSAGGTLVPVTKLNAGEVIHRVPLVLPGSESILFSASGNDRESGTVDLISLPTGARKTVVHQGALTGYVSAETGTGHLLYHREGRLYAVPFDPNRVAASGAATSVLEDVSDGTHLALSGNGTLVYVPKTALQSTLRISTVDVTGKAQPLHTIPGNYRDIRLSPDGRKLAFVMGTDSGSNIWVKDLDRDTVSRISFLTGRTFYPLWTPDGKGILFRSDHVAAPGLYAVPSDGSGEAKRLISDDTRQPNAFSFSPDGKHLAIVQTGDHGNRQIFTVSAEINATSGAFGVRLGKAAPFLGTSFDEQLPAFSPDGKWLAYMVVTPGASEVYVRPFPGPGGQWQVSTGGGSRPRWSRNGRELFFSAPDGRVMVVGYADKGDSLVLGKPRVFTELRLLSQGSSNNYDVSVDGKRIVAILEEENAARSSGPTHLTFLLNFGDELRRKAPAGE